MAKRSASSASIRSTSPPSLARSADPGLIDDVHNLTIEYLLHHATEAVLQECALHLSADDTKSRNTIDATNSHLRMVDSFFHGFVKSRPHMNTPILALRLQLLQFATLLSLCISPSTNQERLAPESLDALRTAAYDRSYRWLSTSSWLVNEPSVDYELGPVHDLPSQALLVDLIQPLVKLTAARSRLGEGPSTSFRSTQTAASDPGAWHVLPIWLVLAADLMSHAAVQLEQLKVTPLVRRQLCFCWGHIETRLRGVPANLVPSNEDLALGDIFLQDVDDDSKSPTGAMWEEIKLEATRRTHAGYTPKPWPHSGVFDAQKTTRKQLLRSLLGFVEALAAGLTPPLLTQLDQYRAGEADDIELDGMQLSKEEIERLVAIVEGMR